MRKTRHDTNENEEHSETVTETVTENTRNEISANEIEENSVTETPTETSFRPRSRYQEPVPIVNITTSEDINQDNSGPPIDRNAKDDERLLVDSSEDENEVVETVRKELTLADGDKMLPGRLKR